MLKFKKLPYEDIKTSDFGKEVTIRVNAESIQHYVKKLALFAIISKMGLTEEEQTPYNVAAGLMAICTDPKTGGYSFEDDQLGDFTNMISVDLFSKLSLANLKVNPSNFDGIDEKVKSLSAKKKNT